MHIIPQLGVERARPVADLSPLELQAEINVTYRREGSHSRRLDQLLRMAYAAARERWNAEGVVEDVFRDR